MSVTGTLTLPDQPALGAVRYEPLGGNGLVAPLAQYTVDNYELTGDASGGVVEPTIACDPRYSCLLVMVSTVASGGTISAGVGCRISIKLDSDFEWAVAATGQYVSPDNVSRVHLSPDPVFDMQSVRCRWDNVDGAAYKLDAVIYLFAKNVKQLVPMNVLVAALPRPATTIP